MDPGEDGSARRRLALAILALDVALVLGGFALLPWTRDPHILGDDVAVAVIFPVVGALLAYRVPRNPLGWLFLFGGTGGALAVASGLYAAATVTGTSGLPGGLLVTRAVLSWTWTWPYLVIAPLLLLFPAGTLPSRRWRPVLVLAVAAGALGAGALLTQALRIPAEEMFTDGPPEGAEVTVALGAAAVYALCALVSVAAPAMRWRRARGVERQQLRWFGFAGVIAVVTLVVTTAVDLSALGDLPGVIGISAVPLGMAVAVLRYRLYDLDRLINRTAVYSVLTAVLAVTYLGGVAVLRGLLAPVTGESQLAVAGSTLAVAGVAAPLRARIQSAVDRRFNRRRYDARQTVEAFRVSLRDELDLDALTAELLSTVERTVDPAGASLWLRSPGGGRTAGAPARDHLPR